MVGNQILHYPSKADEPLVYKILEKLGKAVLRLNLHNKVDKTKACFAGQGGLVRRSFYSKMEISNG